MATDKSDLERLRAVLGLADPSARRTRIHALTDDELLRAIRLFSAPLVTNVPFIDDLTEECRSRGLSTRTH